MTGAARIVAMFLLAGLAVVFLRSDAWAENEPWELRKVVDTRTKKPRAEVFSVQFYGARESVLPQYTDLIGFVCLRDTPVSEFGAFVSVVYNNTYPLGDYTVISKVDDGRERKTDWQPNPDNRNLGLILVGQQALDLALEITNGKHQVIIETPRGVIVNDLKNAKKNIGRALRHCRLK